jgi:hypothetical protein
MKLSLLDIVQDVLNDIDSDEVNSIDDTVEAAQVAAIVKSTYFAMMSSRNWAHLRKSIQLIPTTNQAQPTHMFVKDDIKELSFINYDTRKAGETRAKYLPMKWREPDDFLRLTNAYNNDAENVTHIQDDSQLDMNIMNDRSPTFYTSFDDKTLVFNAYDSARESNLLSTYVQAMAYVMPKWLPADDFIPDLPEEAFSALVEEAKSRASLKLRQVADQKSEQESRRQQKWLSRKNRRVQNGIRYPDYGRGRGRSSSPYIDKNNVTPES